MDLDAMVASLTRQIREKEPSERLAKFKAERAVTALAIENAEKVEDLKEVLRFLHRKIYS